MEITPDLLGSQINILWLGLSAMLVFIMQAGFALVEIGSTRAKNSASILMKNIADMAMGALAYFLVGWGIMYGADALGLVGTSQFGLAGADASTYRDWFFQVVFAATAATIVSGTVCERMKFGGYLIVSLVITAVIYTVPGHWVWSADGWLAKIGFHDFAGSTVVHSLGGWVALWGAIFVGPRIGKYLKRTDGSVRIAPITGHNLPLVGLGTFLLWFGWYGFNGGSTLSGLSESIPIVLVNTTLGASSGVLAALIFSWARHKKADAPLTLNGALAGLVAITAGAYVLTPVGAIAAGAVGGIVVVISCLFFERTLKIDDPVGAISVHGVVGVWGTLAVGLFGNLELLNNGLSRAQQIGVQALGSLVYFAWASIASIILFSALKAFGMLRVSKDDEIAGLDASEHGNESYSGFQIFLDE